MWLSVSVVCVWECNALARHISLNVIHLQNNISIYTLLLLPQVMKRDGSVWATGYNDYGQLGDGATIAKIDFAIVASTNGSSFSAMLVVMPVVVALILKLTGTLILTLTLNLGCSRSLCTRLFLTTHATLIR